MRSRGCSGFKSKALLAARAQVMRAYPTDTESRLWAAIRGERLGVTFRRQVPLGGSIVDFFAPAAGLVVEVDGGYHLGRAAADASRQRKLEQMGYRVVRLEAELVRSQLDVALERILAALE